MDIKKLDDLYYSYRFELLPISNANFRVYSFTSKYFSNADIIILNNKVGDSEVDQITTEVKQLGFSVTKRNYKTIEEAEDSLFDGFFDIERSKKLLIKSYNEYAEKIKHTTFGLYEYIHSEYVDVEKSTINTNSIVNTILEDLNISGPVLIMLEAPAGFGKTSTSYEVIRKIAEQEKNKKVLLFTELSRNRQASIFKYVLYDEINRRFTGLNLELVIKNIVEGRIPVIIDGFDELLKAKGQEHEEKFEDAEPMLETIKELLNGEAKILLTTRRTAIFSEDDFFSWLNRNSNDFTFKRYSISSPTIRDWISPTKEKELERAGLNIKSISNPVLLSYLRSLDDEQFKKSLKDIDTIIDEYMSRLMDREITRQELPMSVLEQKRILKLISNHLTQYDITSESKEALEKLILEKEQDLMFDVLERFPTSSRPTIEQLINKLTIHAFLDRKGESGQRIGFVNDFIFGSFVGENLLEEGEEWIGMERFIDFILTAYTPRKKDTKKKIYDILSIHLIDYLNMQKRVLIDTYLLGAINRDLDGEYISDLEFRDTFTTDIHIRHTIIADCEFHNIIFDFCNINNTHFINCSFYDSVIPSEITQQNNIIFSNCISNNPNDFVVVEYEITTGRPIEDRSQYERKVLEKFWPTGRARFTPHKRPGTLRLGIPPEEIAEVDEAIDALIRRRILIERRGHHSLELNLQHFNEIKEILGR